VCFAGPGAIFAVYTDDERQGKTVRARHDMEKSLHGSGLGVFPDGVGGGLFVKIKRMFTNIFTWKIEKDENV
jgi:hypothetical protein